MKVLLVEPYHAGSHRSWALGYATHSAHDVRPVTHDGNFWRWRMRAGAVTLAEATASVVADWGRPDVVFVSDMVNVAAYLGLCRRTLGDVPVALYMHENQLSYPLGANQQPDEALSLVNWVSMAAADQVFVNSAFHLAELARELPRLLKRAPDHPQIDLLDAVLDRARVLPVGVELADIVTRPTAANTASPLVLWSHRWDHDKNPEAVFRALYRLADEGVPFRLALAGENQRVDPQEFDRVQQRLADRVDHVGFLPRADYVELLSRSDVVVSAASHEFFGIAMVEAMVAGAVPVLPHALSYPEIVPQRFHDHALYPSGALTDRLRAVLADVDTARSAVDGLGESLRRYDWSVMAPQYDQMLAGVVAG